MIADDTCYQFSGNVVFSMHRTAEWIRYVRMQSRILHFYSTCTGLRLAHVCRSPWIRHWDLVRHLVWVVDGEALQSGVLGHLKETALLTPPPSSGSQNWPNCTEQAGRKEVGAKSACENTRSSVVHFHPPSVQDYHWKWLENCVVNTQKSWIKCLVTVLFTKCSA